MTITPDRAAALRKAAAKQREWTHERDGRIRQAHAAGASLREIAAAVGMSHTAVRKIVNKT